MNLFQYGEFRLSSGRSSMFKVECDAFCDRDWWALAEMAQALVGAYSTVEGVPRGGIHLANAMERYCICRCGSFRKAHEYAGACADFVPDPVLPHLVCDDVLTTGASMERAKAVHSGRAVKGIVAFARGSTPDWIRAVWSVHPELRHL